MSTPPITILGAGLAGLSLADALLDAGVRAPVVLIDRRRAWGRDRTWCTWDVAPLRHRELASHRWTAWEVVSGGRASVQRSARHPYLHIDSRSLYSTILARLGADPRVVLRPAERVRSVRDGGALPEVVTDRETFTAGWVIDALGPRSPLLAAGSPSGEPPAPALVQAFLGWEVETEAPAFDPGVATLMDFRPSVADALTFVYVLPFSATRALVEHTTIGPRARPPAGRRRELLAAELGGRAFRIVHEERGAIPMDARPVALVRGPRVLAAGAAGGAIRASSGYAFTRTQRHAVRLAHALVAGTPPPGSLGSTRLRALDGVFLRALAGREDRGEALFAALARGVPGDAFARFMADSGTPVDEARVLAALPPGAMGRPALRSALARFR